MKEIKPFLKYAVRFLSESSLKYRGKIIDIKNYCSTFNNIKQYLDGNYSLEKIYSLSSISTNNIDSCLDHLEKEGFLVYVTHDFSVLSGERCFWYLENILCEEKFYKEKTLNSLEVAIKSKTARTETVKGFLIEKGYLLRNVTSELAFSINSSYDEILRNHYVNFFIEEYNHGEIIYKRLSKIIESEILLKLRPLPSTLGLLNTYRWLATDPLYYATALIHDEGCSFDPNYSIYDLILEKYSEIKNEVPKIFIWHDNLDKTGEHSFFPLKIFQQYELISKNTLYQLKANLKNLIEQHNLFKNEILNYYENNMIISRKEDI